MFLVWDVCGLLCSCVWLFCMYLRQGNTKGIFIYILLLMAARGGKGVEGDEGRSLHEGSVSMVTPHPLSAPLKAVLRQQMFVSLSTLRGWVAGGRVEQGAGGGT